MKHLNQSLNKRMLKGVLLPMVLSLLFQCGFSTDAQSSDPFSRNSAERRAESLLQQTPLEEKIRILAGLHDQVIVGILRLGVSTLKTADGPLRVRKHGPAMAMAGGIALGATWNPELAGRAGVELGKDARAISFGPGVNIYRAPMNGREYEYFGQDSFLASRIGVSYIKGVQSRVTLMCWLVALQNISSFAAFLNFTRNSNK